MRLLLVTAAAALSVPGTHKRPICIAPGLEVTVLEADEGKPGGVHTGTVTWSGGRALAGYLSEKAHLVRGKHVAEDVEANAEHLLDVEEAADGKLFSSRPLAARAAHGLRGATGPTT